jgi:hypothetical protein
MSNDDRRLIEDCLPIEAISKEASRERARRPSGDQPNQKILSEVKCVTAFGGPPANGCDNRPLFKRRPLDACHCTRLRGCKHMQA